MSQIYLPATWQFIFVPCRQGCGPLGAEALKLPSLSLSDTSTTDISTATTHIQKHIQKRIQLNCQTAKTLSVVLMAG
uniref:Uncharacterized protein n=1 Tax=Anguilla anguilla TaxID=7936 RepID=A0A0E9XFA7_ANGAN